MQVSSPHTLAFVTMYNFCPPALPVKKITLLHYCAYIPLVGMIISIALFILYRKCMGVMVKGLLGEPFRACAARHVVVSIALGPLLLLVDLVGTLMKAILKINTQTLDDMTKDNPLARLAVKFLHN